MICNYEKPLCLSTHFWRREREKERIYHMEEFNVENWEHLICLNILVKWCAFVCMHHLFSLSRRKMQRQLFSTLIYNLNGLKNMREGWEEKTHLFRLCKVKVILFEHLSDYPFCSACQICHFFSHLRCHPSGKSS